MTRTISWRGLFENDEYRSLHRDAFKEDQDSEGVDWVAMTERHSLGWVTARDRDALIGFVNVVWDGSFHAWIQDLMVSSAVTHQGVGTRLIQEAREQSSLAGCQWLHVDFDASLAPFYLDTCGFKPSSAGLLKLS